MLGPDAFEAHSLRASPHGGELRRILAAAFEAADPGEAVRRSLRAGPIRPTGRVFGLGFGKAAPSMMRALVDLIPVDEGLVITKHASRWISDGVAVLEGDHPIPADSSLAAGRAALKFLDGLTPNDLLICLISGGGSALMIAPTIQLQELQSITSALLRGGAPVDEINTIRRHLDRLKGGGLAQSANGAQVVGLILSDVVGDSLAAIASGPTAPDSTTSDQARSILRKYKIRLHDESQLRETAKESDAAFRRVENRVIASNHIALLAAEQEAQARGFVTRILNHQLQGEAHTVARDLCKQIAAASQELKRPFCLLAGGETTVTVKGAGRGGRNQELALAAVQGVSQLQDVAVISIATDGEDGPTDAAGAIVTDETLNRARALGLDPAEYLANNDSYTFFERLDDLIKTGPSGTNVNDIVLCFAF